MQQMDHSMETLPTAVRREGLGSRRLLINDIIKSNEVKTPHLHACTHGHHPHVFCCSWPGRFIPFGTTAGQQCICAWVMLHPLALRPLTNSLMNRNDPRKTASGKRAISHVIFNNKDHQPAATMHHQTTCEQ